MARADEPGAIERIERLDGADGRWQPEFLSLATALENSRKDQTYNTPALATLLLLADQLEWMLGSGGLDGASSAARASAGHLYGWAESSEFATPVRRRPGEALAGRRHDRLRRRSRRGRARGDAARNGIVDVEPYRKLGRNQLRIAMFCAIDPADVEALTACIDWVVENDGGGPR